MEFPLKGVYMPALYAHYCFGMAALNKLDWPFLSKNIENHRDLFLAGLAGPNIFSYFEPLHDNPVRGTSYAIHQAPAEDFFIPAAEALARTANPDASMAYLLGCICHFVLDNVCHEYIKKAATQTNVSSLAIEAALDRELLLDDDQDLDTFNTARYLHPSRSIASVMANFYPTRSPYEIQKSMESMIFYADWLLPSNIFKKMLLKTILAPLRRHPDLCIHNLIRTEQKILLPYARDLIDLMDEAVPPTLHLMKNFYRYQQGIKSLDPLFSRPFEA